jgi:hypothetical protein
LREDIEIVNGISLNWDALRAFLPVGKDTDRSVNPCRRARNAYGGVHHGDFNSVWVDDSHWKRRFKSLPIAMPFGTSKRYAAFSLSLLPGGKIASNRGNAPTVKERG